MAVIEKEVEKTQQKMSLDATLITAAACNNYIEIQKLNADDDIVNSTLANLVETIANTKDSVVALRQLQLD